MLQGIYCRPRSSQAQKARGGRGHTLQTEVFLYSLLLLLRGKINREKSSRVQMHAEDVAMFRQNEH